MASDGVKSDAGGEVPDPHGPSSLALTAMGVLFRLMRFTDSDRCCTSTLADGDSASNCSTQAHPQ